MTGKLHNTLISGSISIDKIINKYGTYTNVLGGSAAYTMFYTRKNMPINWCGR